MDRLEVSVGARLRFPAIERAALVAGLIFFAEAAQFMLVIVLGASIAPGYGLNASTISELGVAPETATLFNSSLMAVGVLNIVGGALFHRTHRRVWITAVFVVAGVGALGAGVINLGVSSDIHNLAALVAFIGFGVQPAVAAMRLRGPIRLLAALASIASLAFTVVMLIGEFANESVFGVIGRGGAERMVVYPIMLWMMAFGGYLIAPQRP